MDVVSFFRQELKGIYKKEEIDQFIFFAFAEYLEFSRADLVVKANDTMSESELLKFNFCVKDLKRQKPIQYILGTTEFYGCKIKVNEHVLIPRPETEELVDWVVKESGARGLEPRLVLDIGTGSGCIAIALKKKFPRAEVFGIDFSEAALELAVENAGWNGVEVNFMAHNILEAPEALFFNNLDLVVSNPPYVKATEKKSMAERILNFEPHSALFVDNENPFIFYKAIVDFVTGNKEAAQLLPHWKDQNRPTEIYFEINEALGNELKEVLIEKGLKHVVVKKDLAGKDRFARGEI